MAKYFVIIFLPLLITSCQPRLSHSEMITKYLQNSGINDLILHIPLMIETEFSYGIKDSTSKMDSLITMLCDSINHEEQLQKAYDYYLLQTDSVYISRLLRFYSQKYVQEIVAAEKQVLSVEHCAIIDTMGIPITPKSMDRGAHLWKFMEQTNSQKFMAKNMSIMLNYFLAQSLISDSHYAQILDSDSTLTAEWDEMMTKELMISLYFTYHEINDAKLYKYFEFFETSDGRKMSRLSSQLLSTYFAEIFDS